MRGSVTTVDPLTALRRSYTRSVPIRLRTLASAIHAWRRAPHDAELLAHARTLAHRLRGTAGSYGLREVSAAVGTVEDWLRLAGEPGPDGKRSTEIPAGLRDAHAFATDAIARLTLEPGAQ